MLNFKTVNILTLIAILALLLANYYTNLPNWLYFFVIIIWFTLTVIGSFHIRWNYHFPSLNANKKIAENQIAITFDDGPNPEFTPKILTILKKYNAKATFFCIGKHIEKYPELTSELIKQGHTIGNHTYSHSNNFGFFKTEDVISELQQTNRVAKDKTGLTLNLYRPAFGVTNPRIKKALKITGLQSIGWNKRSYDTTSINADAAFNKVIKKLSKGDVILLHDTSLKTVTVLEQLLQFLKQKNIESVTIDSLFNIKAYA